MSGKKAAVIYISRVLGERVIGLLLFLWGSGRVLPAHAAVYFAVYFGAAALSAVYLRHHGETLKARANVSRDTPTWDKLILTAFWLTGYFIIYYAAGRTAAQGGSLWLSIAGGVLYLLSTLLTDAALAGNPLCRIHCPSAAGTRPAGGDRRALPFCAPSHVCGHSAVVRMHCAVLSHRSGGGVQRPCRRADRAAHRAGGQNAARRTARLPRLRRKDPLAAGAGAVVNGKPTERTL